MSYITIGNKLVGKLRRRFRLAGIADITFLDAGPCPGGNVWEMFLGDNDQHFGCLFVEDRIVGLFFPDLDRPSPRFCYGDPDLFGALERVILKAAREISAGH